METVTGNTQIQPTVSDYSSLERKKWVLSQYLGGRYPYQIQEEYRELYQLSEHSFQKDVLWVNTQLRKKGENEVDAIIERHTDRYNHLYQLAVEKGDLRSGVLALKGIEDLYKIHKDKSTTVGSVTLQQTNNLNLPPMSVNEIRELLGKEKIIDLPTSNTEDYSA